MITLDQIALCADRSLDIAGAEAYSEPADLDPRLAALREAYAAAGIDLTGENARVAAYTFLLASMQVPAALRRQEAAELQDSSVSAASILVQVALLCLPRAIQRISENWNTSAEAEVLLRGLDAPAEEGPCSTT